MKQLLTLLCIVIGTVALIGLSAWKLNAPLSRNQRPQQSSRPPMGNRSENATGHVVAEGRVTAYPGSLVTVSAEITGKIMQVMVEEKSIVRKGELIVEIRADEQQAALTEATARIAEIDAEIRRADHELERIQKLKDAAVATEQEVDRAKRDYDLATAQRLTALATVKRLEVLVSKSLVRSPIDGVVLKRHAHPGEMAETGTRLVTIADKNRVRIEAEVDEFDSARVALGQPVNITAEGYVGKNWKGTVEEIPDSVSEKTLKPLDPGRPTDARVLRVKIGFQEPTPLKLDQRVEVDIQKR